MKDLEKLAGKYRHFCQAEKGEPIIWVGEEVIHDLDHGSLRFDVELDGHCLAFRQWWENCGLCGETISCSCGFTSTEHQGNGCWQYGHNKAQEHGKIDVVHAGMIISALEEAQKMAVSYPAMIRGLALLAICNLTKKDAGSFALIKRAQRLAQ